MYYHNHLLRARDIREFISTWDTTNTSAGSSNPDQVSLPLVASGIYNFTVDWGDGNQDVITVFNQAEATHTYSVSGAGKVITITGTIKGWRFNDTLDREKITNISDWGPLQMVSDTGYFKGCANLTVTATSVLDLNGITSLDESFAKCSSLTTFGGLGNWDTSNITTLRQMFLACSSFNDGTIDSWDVSNVLNVESMFNGATVFNQSLNSWNVGSVTNFKFMFISCSAFNGNITSWITSAATTMVSMFDIAPAFNQDIGSWDVTGVLDMNAMFKSATAFNQDISSWSPGVCTSFANMFRAATSFDQDIGSWDITSMTSAANMFLGVTLSTVNYDALLVGWEAQTENTNVPFDGGNSLFTKAVSAAETARSVLIATSTWTITDGGPTP